MQERALELAREGLVASKLLASALPTVLQTGASSNTMQLALSGRPNGMRPRSHVSTMIQATNEVSTASAILVDGFSVELT